jgi:two-component system sensor histidine kinase PilS (NtrC family)
MKPRSRVPTGRVGAFAVRLLALGAIFALAVVVELRGTGSYSERELTALYALVLAGFLATLGIGVLGYYGSQGRRLDLLELCGDGLFLTGLVYCSGGIRSLFGVLYVIWIVHAAVRAGSRGALLAAIGASIAYGVAAIGPQQGWFPSFEGNAPPVPADALAVYGIHTAGFLVVALLAHRLAAQLKLRQDQLLELGELHQRTVDNVSSGLLTVDRAERITSFNREAERITGFGSHDVLGSPLEHLFPSLREAQQAVSSERADGNVSRSELTFESRQGERLYLGFSRSALRDSRGRLEGAILIFQDLTQVREMEEQLRRSERLSAVGQLAAGLAHEIRNPLASLSGAIELLAADMPETDESSRRLLRIVWRETERLNRLVSDFLEYAGTRPARRERVELRGLFEELAQLLASGDHAGIELHLDLGSDLAVCGDTDLLRQAFWNLLLNAAQAEPDDDVVSVTGAWGAGQVEIEVADRGKGIPDSVLERLFEPFFTTKPKGIGLGLAMVHRVIEAHGGSISVESELDRGTSVRLLLPQEPA